MLKLILLILKVEWLKDGIQRQTQLSQSLVSHLGKLTFLRFKISHLLRRQQLTGEAI